MNKLKRFCLAACVIIAASTFGIESTALSDPATEERFHDLFVTAGYSTAFGAALGAALLSFSAHPESDLQYVAVGASLGFIGGSVLGSYVIFQPMFVADSAEPGAPYRLSGIEGSMTLAKF